MYLRTFKLEGKVEIRFSEPAIVIWFLVLGTVVYEVITEGIYLAKLVKKRGRKEE